MKGQECIMEVILEGSTPVQQEFQKELGKTIGSILSEQEFKKKNPRNEDKMESLSLKETTESEEENADKQMHNQTHHDDILEFQK